MDTSCKQRYITNSTNTRMKANGLPQRRMDASVEEDQSPDSAVAPYMDGRTGQF